MAPIGQVPEWFKEARGAPCMTGGSYRQEGFVEKSLRTIAAYAREAASPDETAGKRGLLQALDVRARMAGMLLMIIAAAITASAWMLAALGLLCVMTAIASRVSMRALAGRVAPSLAFTAVIAAPVFFGIGMNGGRGHAAAAGAFFIARAAVMVSFASILALTTTQTGFFKGIGRMPLPPVFTAALFMTFRYVFILLKIAEDAAFARKSRAIGKGSSAEARSWFASRMALLLHKSLCMAEDVFMAMASRGFNGGRIRTADPGRIRPRDYLWIGAASFVLFLSFGL
ncbi:MAG: hypothetical protein HY894_10110 [Deltaproteobacteria bacterium]|nr:hypothetical protein [Deltaproteobacteria bacterium]